MKNILVAMCVLLLSGCFTFGGQTSRVEVSSGCKVAFEQKDVVRGDETSSPQVEKISVDRDCNVDVVFEGATAPSSPSASAKPSSGAP